RDDRGRFMDDDDRGYRSRGDDRPGGWYGDPDRHSEASRRGWGERESGGRGTRSYRDDERHYGRDHDRDRGQGGWFGDREGHAEASRRGWEDRNGGGGGARRHEGGSSAPPRRRDEGGPPL